MTDPWDRLLPFLEWRGDCLVFTGGLSRKGYGLFSLRLGPGYWRKVLVHRWVYEQSVGPIPDGLTLDHVAKRGCVSRACVWVDHLEPVTRGDNVRRGYSRRTTCPQGHPYDAVDRHGHRLCLTCKHAADKRWRDSR